MSLESGIRAGLLRFSGRLAASDALGPASRRSSAPRLLRPMALRISAKERGKRLYDPGAPAGASALFRAITAPAKSGRVSRISSLVPSSTRRPMMLVCARCGFSRSEEAGIRLGLCPRCQAGGKEVYLERKRARRRYDLVGLLADSRAQLRRSSDMAHE